ncbi:anthrax toxin receptor-like isoform X1 [Mus caroli]|uniref:Anthrax toxin receptor-like isoform X1 n=1 Tax=Mus caroli TaxID=10089 RepID=A0A6P5R793_MUSCR|nr:anthrax toxin receptor-like isoform X1 [Mus caroli]
MLSCCPQVPHSVIFLLMLLPSLLRTENFLYQYHDWKNYHGLGLDPRTFSYEDQNPKHMWHQRNSAQEPCQATPDIYFVLDKSAHMLYGWPHIPKFVLDLVTRLSNPDLRVSIITYSCKGNVILPITGDREEILKGIERMKYSITAGHELIYQGLWKANKQIIRGNRRGAQHPSMVIFLLHGPLDNQAYGYSLAETNDTRRMGGYVCGVGTGQSERNQIIGLAGSQEYAFTNKKPEELSDLIIPLSSKACPSLKTAITRIICIRESNPVVLEGYGFDFARRKEDVICRFYFGGAKKTIIDSPPINITKTTVTCPGPIVDSAGRAIHIQLSLDNGKNFLHNHLYVASRTCGKSPLTTVRYGSTTTTRRTTTTTTTTTTPSTTPTTETTTKEPKPSIDKFIFAPVLLALLLLLLLIGCFWQLCCVPPVKELPPPKPQPQPREKKQPPPVSPPVPTRPVNPPPILIICCCTCRGLYVSRDMKGNVTVCNFNPLCCPQLPLRWPQYGGQGWFTNWALLKEPCIPMASLPAGREHLPLASCSQCHRLSANHSRYSSNLRQLALHPWAPRVPQSLPPT